MSATSKRNRALAAGEEPVTGKEMADDDVVRELPDPEPEVVAEEVESDPDAADDSPDAESTEENENVE